MKAHNGEKSKIKVFGGGGYCFLSWENYFSPLVACMAPSSTVKANQ